jgi:hypothetical protein
MPRWKRNCSKPSSVKSDALRDLTAAFVFPFRDVSRPRVVRFRLMVKRGPFMRRQASEGEAQHGLFCRTRCVGQGDERLSLSSWLAAGIVPGIERRPLKKIAVDESALLRLLHRWREEAEKAGCRSERIVCGGSASWPGLRSQQGTCNFTMP